jgi:thiamine phosphate synthase YjbQ (UPF0047 family)
MNIFTDYPWFNTTNRQEFVRITDQVPCDRQSSGINDGMVLVSAMHITAGVFVNDRLGLGPWEQVFYAEFDGQRKKRVVVKVMGQPPAP